MENREKKIACLFAGQGSQYVGMGQSFAEEDWAKQFFDYDQALTELCFRGEKDVLGQTQNTQRAVLLHSIVAYEGLRRAGITPDAVCGLSLGEYTALYAAGVFSFASVMDLVKYRGQLMADSLGEGKGKMVAVLSEDIGRIEKACKAGSEIGIVEIANYNALSQTVIAGEVEAVNRAVEYLKENGVRRCLPLAVSGAFHTSLLNDAAVKLRERMEETEFHEMKIPVLFNYVGDVQPENMEIRELLEKQICNSVRFYPTLQKLQEMGITHVIEIGPGNALSGFVKKSGFDFVICHVEDVDSLAKTIEVIQDTAV